MVAGSDCTIHLTRIGESYLLLDEPESEPGRLHLGAGATHPHGPDGPQTGGGAPRGAHGGLAAAKGAGASKSEESKAKESRIRTDPRTDTSSYSSFVAVIGSPLFQYRFPAA